MTAEQIHRTKNVNVIHRAGPRGIPFIMTYIGAAIYFIEQSSGGFFDVVLALLQAIVWPVYVVYHVLQILGA